MWGYMIKGSYRGYIPLSPTKQPVSCVDCWGVANVLEAARQRQMLLAPCASFRIDLRV